MSRYTRCAAPNGLFTAATLTAGARFTGGLHDSCGLRRLHDRFYNRAILWCAPDTKALSGTSGFRSPKEFLEVAVLGEDVGQRLVHDLIGGGVEKGCVLVNLFGGGYIKANRRVDVAG